MACPLVLEEEARRRAPLLQGGPHMPQRYPPAHAMFALLTQLQGRCELWIRCVSRRASLCSDAL